MPGANILRRGLVRPTIFPQTIASDTTVNGDQVDRRGHEQALIVVITGTIAAGTLDVKMQESDTAGSGDADITSAAFPQIPATADKKFYVATLDLRKRKRYLRAVATTAGSSTSTPITVLIILSDRYATLLNADVDDGSAPAFQL